MKKLKLLFLQGLANKYAGSIVAWASGFLASAILTFIANGHAWLGKVLLVVLGATSDGQITEINNATLLAILTPIIGSAFQAIMGYIQANNGQKVQRAVGEVPDGYIGPETVNSVAKK